MKRGIKRFVIATAGGVKRVSVETGRRGVRLVGRSVRNFTRRAYREWSSSAAAAQNDYVYTRDSRLRRRDRGKRVSKSQISRPVMGTRSVSLQTPVSIVTDIPFTPAPTGTTTVHPATHPEQAPQQTPRIGLRRDREPIDTPPPGINPASSIDELLRAYLVRLGPFREYIPPPCARAIFPPNYNVRLSSNRVYTRPRPGSARPFSRASNRPFARVSHARGISRGRSMSSCAETMGSDSSSDVLGLTPLYERTGEMPSPFLRRPRARKGDSRPGTAESTVPRLRTREKVVQVVSVGIQTSPPPLSPAPVATTSVEQPQRRGHRRGASRFAQARDSLHLSSRSGEICSSGGDDRKLQVAFQESEREGLGTPCDDDRGSSGREKGSRKVSFSTREERIYRRQEAVRNIIERTSTISHTALSEHRDPPRRYSFTPSTTSTSSMGSEAIGQYYRSQGVDAVPSTSPGRSDISSMRPWPADKKLVYPHEVTPKRRSSVLSEREGSATDARSDLFRARSAPVRGHTYPSHLNSLMRLDHKIE